MVLMVVVVVVGKDVDDGDATRKMGVCGGSANWKTALGCLYCIYDVGKERRSEETRAERGGKAAKSQHKVMSTGIE